MLALQNSPEVLPELSGFTSRPVLFIVNGRRYAGHYHLNGLFYVADERKYDVPIGYARHPKTDAMRLGLAFGHDVPLISSWEYL